MKKIISSVLILLIFITSFTISFGNESINKILLKENGNGKNYQVVNLKIDSKTVKSADVPPIIYPLNNQGRTLVPLRMIIEHLEDKLNAEIKWNGTEQEVKIETKDKEIILKIDSPIALVNGVKKKLPDNVPAKLLALGDNGRTMVPIRFFAEEFGIDINWNEKTVTASLETPENIEKEPTRPEIPEEPKKEPENPLEKPNIPEENINIANITDVKVEMNGHIPQIRIKTSKKTDYKEFKLSNPERLVIDLSNARFNLDDKKQLQGDKTLDIKTNSGSVKRVRVSQFQKPTEEKPEDLYITRVVLELGSLDDYEIRYDAKTKEVVIDFVNHINNISKQIINAKEVIVIEGDYVDDYNIIRLSNPERIVVDIKGGVLNNRFKNNTINVDGRVVKSIRASQYEDQDKKTDEKVTRVVIDLYENMDYEETYIEIKDNKLKIHVEGEPFKAILYQEIGWTSSTFTLKGSTVTKYNVDYQLAPSVINITVPKTDIDLELVSLKIEDHIINTMKIKEYGNNYNVELRLEDGVEYKLLSSERGKDLILELNNRDAKYREMLIVIDPGHGGTDPGAISSINNMKESEVVLDMSLKLNQLLAETGFRTYMTRVDNLNNNSKLSLQDRSDIANALEADLFISVHANSFTSSSVNGIETYYEPNDMASKKLAEIFQSQLINDLNMNNRGAKSANYFVLRNTNMPAVLVESGFLSNPSDAAKLASDTYKNQIAQSMVEATIKYFEETK